MVSGRSVLEDAAVAGEFKEMLKRFKREALRRVMRNLGSLEAIKRKYPFQYLFFGPTSPTFKVQRSIVTWMGREVVPRLLEFLAKKRGFETSLEHRISITLPVRTFNLVSRIVSDLYQGKRKPDPVSELEELCRTLKSGGSKRTERIVADLHITSRDDPLYSMFLDLKSPMPNKDQLTPVKRKMLLYRLHKYVQFREHSFSHEEAIDMALKTAFLGLYYNPFSKSAAEIRKSGVYPHSFFNLLCHVSEALIGEELWDCIGGRGTFEKLVKLIDEVVKESGAMEGSS